MDSAVLGGVAAVAVVIVVGVLARRGSRENGPAMTRPDGTRADTTANPLDRAPVDDDVDDEDDDDDGAESVEVVAVTSDGYALVPDTHAVRLMPPHEDGEAWKAGTTGNSARGQRALNMSWHAGDFTGGRVVQGAADEGPWRWEALGRDGEYTAFVFETREGADAALKLFQSRGVIRLGHDDDGHEVPPSAEQFEEARRIYLETEAALEQDDEPGQ